MFCTKCGRQIPENAKFCVDCGTPVKRPDQEAGTQADTRQPVSQTFSQPSEAGGGQKKRSPLFWVLGGVLVVALAVGGFFGGRILQNNIQCNAALQDGADALEQGQYSQARDYYQNALSLRPDSAQAIEGLNQAEYGAALQEGQEALEQGEYIQAQNHFQDALSLYSDGEEAKDGLAQAVLGQAEQFLRQEEFAQAADLLSGLEINETDAAYARYNSLLSVARMAPDITQVDVGSFPVVSVTLSCGSDTLTADEISIVDNGKERILRDFKLQDGQLSLSYESDDIEFESEHRDFTVALSHEGFTFERMSSYDTPSFEPATVRLISSDVSAYPVIKAYFRVERSDDGTTVQGLDERSFRIQERLQGGEYLAREVRAVSPLENLGLNIDLVADKSDSISLEDMNQIKDVMIQFINNLHYDVGDKAEILAFDDIVQQMCCFTNDTGLLVNGINNMSTDGLTAFYDAVYVGIQNASLQGGARCVIAFTDGGDNRSIHTHKELIAYANKNQVPVYIIGVGNYVEADILQDIATSTGGHYWFISDLYDLQDIFDQVYAEQKELYMIEYVSDSAADQYAPRDLQAAVSGGGYKGDTVTNFTPAFSIQSFTHTSRYELVPGTCTWEEANQRCQEMGGHLATITSQEELDQIIALAEQNSCKYVWLGGYTSYDDNGNVFGHWVTGEDFSFQAWGSGQPSRQDLDSTPEWYIMLWYVRDMWSWNDQRNDPAAVSQALNQNMCFVCEYED